MLCRDNLREAPEEEELSARERESSMQTLNVPVRWYSGGEKYDTLNLELDKTAFMIVDSDGGASNEYVEEGIAPALAAARRIGMRVLFIHNDFSLADEPGSIKREIHGTRWGNAEAGERPPPPREPVKPRYSPSIQPLPDEPDFPKRHQDAGIGRIQPALLPLPDSQRSGGAQLPRHHAAGLHLLQRVPRYRR